MDRLRRAKITFGCPAQAEGDLAEFIYKTVLMGANFKIKMKKHFKILAILVAFIGFSAAGCHKKKDNSASSTPPAPYTPADTGSVTPFPVKEVIIINYHYDPINTTAPIGGSINWTNRDSVHHTVTSASGLFESGDLSPGKNFIFNFSRAGTYDYFCSYHKEGGKIVIQ